MIFAETPHLLATSRKVCPEPRRPASARQGFPAGVSTSPDAWDEAGAWVDVPLGDLGFRLSHPPARADSSPPSAGIGMAGGQPGPLGELHRRAVAAQRAVSEFFAADIDDDAMADRLWGERDDAMEDLAQAIADADPDGDWGVRSDLEDEARSTLPVASVREGRRVYLLVTAFDLIGSATVVVGGEEYGVRPVVLDLGA